MYTTEQHNISATDCDSGITQQYKQCTYNVTMRRDHETIVAVEKKQVLQVYIGLCVHACAYVRACGYVGEWAYACAYVHMALLIKHAALMRHIVTSFVGLRSPLHFSTLPHERYDFRKKLWNIKCVFSFSLQLLSKTLLILRGI